MAQEYDAIVVEQFGGPEVLKLQKKPVLSLEPNQVLVTVRAVGVNPVETYIRTGVRGGSLPYTPGADAAGVVEAVGSKVTQWKVGDRVWTSGNVTGAYASKLVANEDSLHRLPEKVSFEQGAAVHIPYATAYRALLQKARARPSESVLVHGGSGGVGIAAIQLARAIGMTVIATASTEAGRKLVLDNGADHALDHKSSDYLEKLKELTGGRGVDIILEMLANVNLQKDITVLAPFGRVVVIGNRGNIEINPRDLMFRDGEIHGVSLYNTPPDQLKDIYRALVAGLESGSLRPIVGESFPLADAAKAHVAVIEHSSGAAGKIVLLP